MALKLGLSYTNTHTCAYTHTVLTAEDFIRDAKLGPGTVA